MGDVIDEFVRFAAGYDPAFPSRIGASDEQIEHFERLVGHPLPAIQERADPVIIAVRHIGIAEMHFRCSVSIEHSVK